MTLLAVMVIADRKIISTEITAWVKSVISACRQSDQLSVPSEARLYEWFDAEWLPLRETMTNRDLDTWLTPLIDRVLKVCSHATLMGLLEDIAQSDGETHISEKALTVLVSMQGGR